MKIKRIILVISVISIASLIFLFSNQNGNKSISVSDAFAETVIDKYAEFKRVDYSKKEKNKIIKSSRFIVRKSAHFGIYLLLGILIFLLIKSYNLKHSIIWTLIICFLFACTDEFHQIFTPGRTARFYDVVIDTIGCFSGMCLTNLIIKLKNNIKTKKKEVKKYA